MLKKIIKSIVLSLIFTSCSYLMPGYDFKPYTSSYTEFEIYGITKNGKIDRLGELDNPKGNQFTIVKKGLIDPNNKKGGWTEITRDNTSVINNRIDKTYGIYFYFSPASVEISARDYGIKFYNDLKMNIDGEEYVISKKDFEMEKRKIFYDKDPYIKYRYKIPEIINEKYSFILDIGEIEIFDKNGKVVKKRKKIPPLLFKKTITIGKILTWHNFLDIFYTGWIENEKEEKEIFEKYKKILDDPKYDKKQYFYEETTF
ncbi:MAG: hypothetical protein KGV57_05095 [Fusobacterium sp.]|nr:hypothetical protein [Fusobacterium sp.]